ncbi:MAG: hypothetical protein GF416_07290 [Candidatus Altiarchaeales archaeon]|nr:hypothetical protein [Candidatus Altiarchaeales archaeon]MBD3416916.1 hypothetical protein [Candidatus Altiarchaeales archaeon]
MRLLESIMSVGLVLLGAFFMSFGYLVSVRIISLGEMDTAVISNQFQEMGFILVAAGILTWFVAFFLRKAGVF